MTDEQNFFFDDFFSAYEEAKRRRKYLAENGVSIRVEESPYGEGYRLRYIPVAALISTGISPAQFMGNSSGYRDYGRRREKYAF